MRNKASLLLLAVFVIFLGIATFHPFSHGVNHHEDDGHECPICLWLYYAAAVSLFIVVFYIILRVVKFITALPVILSIRILILTNIPRAPPEHHYYSV